MSSNYWASSHCRRWIFTEEQLRQLRDEHRSSLGTEQAAALEDFLLRTMRKLGAELSFRTPVVATAKLLFKRFFTQASLDKFDPRLITVTCLYLAAKVEEMGQFRMRTLLEQIKKHHKKLPNYSQQVVHDSEFHILEKLGFDLVMFHPYRYLVGFSKDAAIPEQVQQTAWNIVNDSYRSDVLLLYPPYMVALAALYISCTHNEHDARDWFNRLNVRLDELRDVVRMIMDMYDGRQRTFRDHEARVSEAFAALNKRFPVSCRPTSDRRRKPK